MADAVETLGELLESADEALASADWWAMLCDVGFWRDR
jgi:hypothetical protein